MLNPNDLRKIALTLCQDNECNLKNQADGVLGVQQPVEYPLAPLLRIQRINIQVEHLGCSLPIDIPFSLPNQYLGRLKDYHEHLVDGSV